MPWVTWIGIEGEDTQESAVREVYDHARDARSGVVPDLVRLTGRTPEVARLLHDLSIAVYKHARGLSVREKEIAALLSSSYVGCVH